MPAPVADGQNRSYGQQKYGKRIREYAKVKDGCAITPLLLARRAVPQHEPSDKRNEQAAWNKRGLQEEVRPVATLGHSEP